MEQTEILLTRITNALEQIASVLTEQTKTDGALNTQDTARVLRAMYKYGITVDTEGA